ncbi:MAG: gamma-glutamyltransferase family protein [Acidimicrobiia bacterium]
MTQPVRNVRGFGDMVSSPHELATMAGAEIFARGGSAVDAAIAVDAVLGVVAPETCGIGGDLFALVWEPGYDEPATLNASGWAGSNVDANAVRAEGHRVMPAHHPASVTIPGCVAGWEALHEKYGRISMGEILAPAIRLAEGGFPASTELASALASRRDHLAPQASGVDMYPGGSAPSRGARLTRPLLASTLSDIITDGAASFYTGKPAADISAAVGDLITVDDLAAYRPEWVEPARLDVFGRTGWTIAPNSQGYLTLATCGVFERSAPPPPDSPEWHHLLIEAYRVMAWDRDDVVTDPATAPYGWRQLLGEDRLAERTAGIDRQRAGTWPAPNPVPGGTSYMCTIGADGQAVSFIQSNFMGIGSGIGAGTSGFFLHNRGAGFCLIPGHPNELTPRRRPLHTLSPSLWTRDGRIEALLGTRGGHQQPQLLAQMAVHLFWAGMDPASAQCQPRWTMDEFGPGAASQVLIESDTDPAALAHLERSGHHLVLQTPLQGGWGPVSAIVVDAEGLRTGAADPRVDTTLVVAR